MVSRLWRDVLLVILTSLSCYVLVRVGSLSEAQAAGCERDRSVVRELEEWRVNNTREHDMILKWLEKLDAKK